MAVLSRTRLETHPDGTVGTVGIIGANWSRIETIFDPALTASDASYNIFAGALIRSALPATNGAVIEWREATTPKKFLVRPGTAASASPILDLTGAKKVVVTLAADPTFSTTNRADGWEMIAIVKAGGSTRTLTFPSWVFVGAAAPATLASGKTAVLELWCNGTNETDIVARWTVQP